jgi:hypothetical protein
MGETGLLNLLLFFLVEIVLTFDFDIDILVVVFPLINMDDSVLNIVDYFSLRLVELTQVLIYHIGVEYTIVKSL